MASQIFKWVRWTLGALFAATMVFVMAATGVTFIITDGSWIAVVLGYGCVAISLMLVTLMFLIIHTMDHK
tara:strand:- start:434 stop:643 length:210 start_codon:yes stop_codon:yes gene_type:complete